MDPFQLEIKKAVEVLRNGGIILYPTDTVWGIGCDATNEAAVKKVFQLKKRTDAKSMIVLVENPNQLNSYVNQIPEQAWPLIEYSERPLTIVYDGAKNLAPSAVAEDGSIAIRITKDDFCRKLISQLRKPIISTSANLSGEKTPAAYHEISSDLLALVDYVVNLRQEERIQKQVSTIIRLRANGQIEFLRK